MSTKKIKCNHEFYYEDCSKIEGMVKSQFCEKCGTRKQIAFNGIFTYENSTLCDLLVVKPKYVSSRTKLAKRKIVFRKGLIKTKYYAEKLTAEVAVKLFRENPTWQDVFVEVPFRGGVIQADVVRKDFVSFFSVLGVDVWKMFSLFPYPIHRKTFEAYADVFTKARLSIFIPRASKLEKFVGRLTNNRYFR